MYFVEKMARIDVSDDLHGRVKAYAALEGITVKEAYGRMIRCFLDERGRVDAGLIERLSRRRRTI